MNDKFVLTHPFGDLDAPIKVPLYAPRKGTFAIPGSGILDEPLICFKVNARWVGHIIGALEILDQQDAWSGTENEVEDARAEIRKLMAMMESCDAMITELRINNCIVEAYIGGAWVPQFDITNCVSSTVEDVANDEYRERPWDEPTNEDRPDPVSDLDCLWGACVSVAVYVMRVASQAADLIETAADAADAASDFLTTIPGFGAVPATKVLTGMQLGFALTAAVIRQAFIQEVQDIIACELFCLIRVANNGNVLTDDILEAWYDAMNAKSAETPLQIWSPGLSFISDIAGNIVGRRYTYSQFILGLNNCDDDWMILCDECDEPEPLGCVDFSDVTNITFIHGSLDAGNGNPAPCGTSASGIAGNSLPLDGSGTTSGIACTVEWTFDQPRIIDGVSFNYLHNHNADNQIGLTVTYRDSIGAEIYRNEAVQTNAKNTWHSRSFSHTESGVKSITVTVFRTSSPAVTGFCRLDNICVVEP